MSVNYDVNYVCSRTPSVLKSQKYVDFHSQSIGLADYWLFIHNQQRQTPDTTWTIPRPLKNDQLLSHCISPTHQEVNFNYSPSTCRVIFPVTP